ncbi:transcriptional regulator [Leuconostoc mesenteroides]|uniref:helix-turn-helix domain-containing protein n=1 Tax=Leuconostoc mesenteroides TaxID=1245 RepID=UPI000C9A1BEA|nr:helix-turn-helix transcriptional regulator [Leuconostoc mesenteroides]PND41322.1 transcriptional regulator [Leuconostoc mesenteroides]
MTLYERTVSTSKKRGYSLKNLAIKAGLAENSIYDWKKSTPKADNLQKVADVLNVSTDYLLGRTDELNHDSSKKTADILDDETILAFDGMEIDEEDKEKLREYARFIMEQRKRGGK